MVSNQIPQAWSSQYQDLINRNIGLVSVDQQDRLKKSRFCIFGMGGVGSPAFEILVRSGIEHFKIVDKDVFDPTNMNRQIFATSQTIGKKKVIVAKDWAQSVNPDIKVDTYEAVEEDNIKEIIDGSDIIVLAIDQLKPCLIISREAYKQNVPVVEGWAIPYGNVRVHTQKTPTLEAAYNLPTEGKLLSAFTNEQLDKMGLDVLISLGKIEGVADFYSDECVERIAADHIPSFAPMVWLTAVLMALEAIKVILIGKGIFKDKNIAFGPDFALYDPFCHRIPQNP